MLFPVVSKGLAGAVYGSGTVSGWVHNEVIHCRTGHTNGTEPPLCALYLTSDSSNWQKMRREDSEDQVTRQVLQVLREDTSSADMSSVSYTVDVHCEGLQDTMPHHFINLQRLIMS